MYMYMYNVHVQCTCTLFVHIHTCCIHCTFAHAVLHVHVQCTCYGIGEGQWRRSEADQTGGGQSPEGEE